MTDIKITPSPYGRWEYVPSGGRVLTAEQMEDVRLLVEYAGGRAEKAEAMVARVRGEVNAYADLIPPVALFGLRAALEGEQR